MFTQTSNYMINHPFYYGFVGEEKDIFNYPTFNGYANRGNFYGYRRNFNKNFNTHNNGIYFPIVPRNIMRVEVIILNIRVKTITITTPLIAIHSLVK